ncbi:MAG: 2-oxoglutarate synthase [Ignavibacteria bacterium GWB2_35_12]|nr:MAG: 2-oxoglutarate synthase [Ignavibacteria bacterium GWB2_35_12]OGU92217.1 MAG: 2-oxoglutarate synthase [Ignavibacteria bacterium RIFOXYA2_FULL_35_10]OGV22561.1 MAG: 2-oxoglutarate synthase [Ignavibacteria bacterium RIFOXYC2_FULL_35_21]
MKNNLLKYLRTEILPTEFCAGCGCGTVLNIFCHVVDEMKINPDDIIMVTGIGCSSWIPSPYFSADTLHTTHGRAIAFATGVKVMKPEKHVIVIAGDGDLAGIGGNHLIHAARRNIDLTVFLVNNYIYGMTGGQVSPTTPSSVPTTTTPYGNTESPFKIAELVAAAGANYAARWTTYHIFHLKKAMKDAIQKKGFSFVEICSQCPTSYGKRIGMREGIDQLKDFRDNSIDIRKVSEYDENVLENKFIVGKIAERTRPEFTESLRKINMKFDEERA